MLFRSIFFFLLLTGAALAQPKLDESATRPGEWGHRPEHGTTVAVTPPSFVWRLNRNIVRWELEIIPLPERATGGGAIPNSISVKDLTFNTHTPSKELAPGRYSWKFRGFDKNGRPSDWSELRSFTVPKDARKMPMPSHEELLGRIPTEHPRIFVRPEGMDRLRELAKSELTGEYRALVKRCDDLLKKPPATDEPPTYEAVKRTPAELDKWWGNRVKTIAVLENAATLAFVWNLDGNEKYAALSKTLLMDAAKWDPKGATGFRYNDEAGMPYNYHFARTYTFLNKYLSEDEKRICRGVMAVRGEEMYKFLCPKLFWTPYSSHDNRSWHFLGEIGLAFYDEIPEAADWLRFAVNKFYAAYPVWCDDDGGWHEGVSYWSSYQIRFCWWADAMRTAFDINAFDKPYYSRIGDFPIYMMPPGKSGGILGDLNQEYKSRSCLELVDIVAMQANNPYWKWYVDAHGNFKSPNNYYTFIRKANSLDRAPVPAKTPTDLPKSKLFRGTGLAMLNTTLLNSDENVQVQFKSTPAPFGSYSHGYDANNSYIFSAWNESLLINTGRRDYYGSPHHVNWMWSTRSENNITVDGLGQLKRSYEAIGEIMKFESSKPADGTEYDIVVGEASQGYRLEKDAPEELKKKYPDGKLLDGFRRSIVFLKPDVLVVFDRIKATEPARFEYWLHAKNPFQPLKKYFPDEKSKSADAVFGEYLKSRLDGLPLTDPGAAEKFEPVTDQRNIALRVDKVACRVDILLPEKLTFTQTNRYDPEPQPKIKVREWHLKAATPEKRKDVEFLMVARPWKVAETEIVPTIDARWERRDGALLLHLEYDGKKFEIRFPDDSDEITVREER